jgi:hypothetical protein
MATLILLYSCLTSGLALAQNDCIDYSDFPNLEVNVDVPGSAQAMVVQGNYIYVAAYTEGLQVVDVFDPATPSLVGGLDTPGQCRGLYCSGGLVYVADGSEGFRIISVAEPQSPQLMGAIDTFGLVRNLKVAGNFAYLAVDWVSGGLMIMDVADPVAPTLVSVSPTAGTARDVEINGHHAYVSDNDGNIYVFDVTDPSSPVQVNTVPVGGVASAMDMHGSLLAVAEPGEGVKLFDLTDPASPTQVGLFQIRHDLDDVVIEGSTAYFLNLDQVMLVDLTDPTDPRELTALPLPDAPLGVAVTGDLVISALGENGVQVIRNNGFDLPVAVGSLSPAKNFSPGPFDIYNGVAFVISDRLYSVMVINPANPLFGGSATVGESNHDIDIQGPYAYIMAEPGDRVHVFNVTNPTAPFRVHDFLAGGNVPRRLLAHGNHLYSGPHTWGLGIADITDPPEAFSLDHRDLGGTLHGMTARGDSLFVGRTHKVDILDISTPTAPVLVGSIATSGTISGVTVQGRYVYIASPYHGLDIADLQQPGVPVVGHYPGWEFRHVTVHDGIAYVSSLRAGLYVFDLSDITQPQLLGIKRGGCAKTMVRGDHLIVSGSGYMGGIEVLPLQCNPLSSVDEGTPQAAGLELSAYPNPFNPQTTFSFSLTELQSVELTVHDLTGRQVRKLVSGQDYSAGEHKVRWDGRDDNGLRLASGKFLGRLEAGGRATTRPVILLK